MARHECRRHPPIAAVGAAVCIFVAMKTGITVFAFSVHPSATLTGAPSCSENHWYPHRALDEQRPSSFPVSLLTKRNNGIVTRRSRSGTKQVFMASSDDEEIKALQEEARLKVLKSRRGQIRGTLKAAESFRNFRIQNGGIPELDENGKPIKSDSKSALTLTAFAVAFGAVILRFGGRAALISGLGLDFATENPGLKENLDSILNYADSLDPIAEGALFILAWTAVKVLCFDAGGVGLALSAGILFGGVLQGALFSAFAATVGSCVAFSLAKMDTPLRKKALEIVDNYPSLRGIEKVVARDGLKAILTLRLAPVLPIPIGMYNYVYGVTNVPFWDFAGGIFIGSIKPYLLDSYLGYFGMTIIEGTAGEKAGTEDFILLAALGVSVLIGVFASQLAGETWDSVKEEIEAEQRAKMADDKEEDDGIVRSVMGIGVPEWIIGFQLALKAANERITDLIEVEYEAKVWNCTKEEGVPPDLDPACASDSPEMSGAGQGFDFASSICDGFVLSPALLMAFMKYSDPLYTCEKDEGKLEPTPQTVAVASPAMISMNESETAVSTPLAESASLKAEKSYICENKEAELRNDQLFAILGKLRSRTQERLKEIEERMDSR